MIAIVMATYHGEAYLSEQIDSILENTCQDFTLFISDDCSSDATGAIAEAYAARYPDRIVLLPNDTPSGGACSNFFRAIGRVPDRYEYYMFCDQDDVWKPDKLALTLEAMKRAERDFGTNTPILVHTDLEVVDESLHTISPSMAGYQNISHDRTAPHQLMIQNTVTGCTAMMNRALAFRMGERPEGCVMHDWWLALIASVFGRIVYLDRATVRYRQHTGNSVGAKPAHGLGYLLFRSKNRGEVRQNYLDTFAQAGAFAARFGPELSREQRELFETYARFGQMGKLEKWRNILRFRLFRNNLFRTVGMFLSI